MGGANASLLAPAAAGILARLGWPLPGPVTLYCTEGKRPLGEALLSALHARRWAATYVPLPSAPATGVGVATSREALQRAAAQGAVVILAEAPQALWLFATVGRPDRGVFLPSSRLYCDWLMPYESLLRILSADYAQLQARRQRLLDTLSGASLLRVCTLAGTELVLAPRSWLSEEGEVFTAPYEGSVYGTLAIDGALYDGPPARPIVLRVVDGHVVNAEALNRADPQQRLLYDDLTRDAAAAQVAEFGLGINPVARPDGPIMEAEMALGTCHLGLGHNRSYGGANCSSIHVDVGLLHPTIVAGEQVLCREGCYTLAPPLGASGLCGSRSESVV